FVVVGVHLAIRLKCRADLFLQGIHIPQVGLCGQIQVERTDLGAKEVIRAARALRGKFAQVVAVDKLKDSVAVAARADHSFLRRSQTSQDGSELGSLRFSLLWCQRGYLLSTEDRSLLAVVISQIGRSRFDDLQAVDIAFVGRVT